MSDNISLVETDQIEDKVQVILRQTDYNEEQEAYELAGKLGWRGSVKEFPYPDGTKDINDVYRRDKQLILNVLG